MTAFKSLLDYCAGLLANKGLMIAFAESATAGKLAFEFSQTEHSGKILKGGLVCYNAGIKEDVLNISDELVEEYSPESAEVTREMALKLKKFIDADIIVAVTGLTTPGGSEHPGKPVGTMFYCILNGKEVFERKKIFTGNSRQIVDLTIEQIVKSLILILDKASTEIKPSE